MSKKTPKGWHRHSNGGGLVQDTATVADTAHVGPNACVSGNARVYGNAEVSGNAQVQGNAWVSGNAGVLGKACVSGNAQVYGNAWVYGDACVSGNAWVYGNAQVYGKACVSGNAQVYGNACAQAGSWKVAPLQVLGGRFDVCVIAPGVVRIGCQRKHIKDWIGQDHTRLIETEMIEPIQVEAFRGLLQWLEWMYDHGCENVCGSPA